MAEAYVGADPRICVVGLGYVGLPLAVALDRRFDVVGFDISTQRVEELTRGFDRTLENDAQVLSACRMKYTTDTAAIRESDLVIITVPTPIDEHRNPDLGPVRSATCLVGQNMKAGTVVVYESTVYPGLTEEECVPMLERESGMKWKEGFFVGYSPERVNPGDREHTVDRVRKVVAGDTPRTLSLLAHVYGAVIRGGIHEAADIRTAEAAKVIENTQRDLNIALMNELSLIFHRMGIDTRGVLEAAATKWNFLPFEPGLVGGHCIGVDPYYLTFKAEALGYHPQMILAGRRLNDGMAKHVAEVTVKKLIDAGKRVKASRVLVLGLTFKENISDIRNTKVADLVRELCEFGVETHVHDPMAYPEEALHEYGLALLRAPEDFAPYDGIVLAVRHREYVAKYDLQGLRRLTGGETPVLIDVKGLFDPARAREAGFIHWRL
ncbi:MAG: nucleotide sugar dehydrogenase [Deltaproteobacteria bacterium]|nr:nucleotide sugar dehydrogenase [Deltaproteobacteria bacterium]